MLKRITRIVARHHGHDVTFMGKPFSDDTGSGFHLHASLLDADGHNVMAEAKGASPDSHETCVMRRRVWGVIWINPWRCLRLMPMPGGGSSLAITRQLIGLGGIITARSVSASPMVMPRQDGEHRCASADANPYLSIALILAAMVEGMEQKLTPPPITTGNAYDQPDREGLPILGERLMPDLQRVILPKNGWAKIWFGSMPPPKNMNACNLKAL